MNDHDKRHCRDNIQSKEWLFLLLLPFTLFISSCESYDLYPGDKLPDDKVATLITVGKTSSDRYFRAVIKELDGTRHYHANMNQPYHLLPGHHIITFDMIEGLLITEHPATIELDAHAGFHYQFHFYFQTNPNPNRLLVPIGKSPVGSVYANIVEVETGKTFAVTVPANH